ncbi:MAG: acyltransferase [Methylococcales bacterium]|nr:acyltransferase [Methylococcales bacterium]
MPTKRIEHIDVWRFFAVMLVIQEHVLLFSGLDVNFPIIETYSLQIERFGELGVLVFFSISGFVICMGLNSEKTKTGRVCLSAFCVRRFFRIVPPLWFYLACITVLSAFEMVNISNTQLLTSAAFLCNLPFEKGCSWFAGHTWSLAYEEQFYLLFPLLFLWAFRGNKAARILVAMGVLIAGALALIYFKQPFWADYCTYFLFLLTGCFTALLPENVMQKLRNLPFSIWLFATILLASSMSFLANEQDMFLKILAYPFLVQIIVFGTPTHFAWIKRFFENASLSYLGRISYSVYLWQELATAYYPNTNWWQTLVYLVLVFVFAAFSFRYFEMPLQRVGTRLSNNLKAAA